MAADELLALDVLGDAAELELDEELLEPQPATTIKTAAMVNTDVSFFTISPDLLHPHALKRGDDVGGHLALVSAQSKVIGRSGCP